MKCALWLNGKKVMSASEIPDNFDIFAVRGYFLGGCFAEWLSDNGGEQYVPLIESLSPQEEKLNEKLMEIFGQTPYEIKLHKYSKSISEAQNNFSSYSGAFSSGSFQSSFLGGSYGYSSSYSSFGFTSFGFTSFGYGSFSGSFYGSSSFMGSFNSFGGALPFEKIGSYISYGSRTPDIIPCCDGSFTLSDAEYDELVRMSFMHCPLNMFGYGIDNI